RIFASMFFIVPGIIFMVLCYDKNKRGLFVPACVMLLLGGYFMLGSFIGMGWIFRLAGGATRFAPYALIAVGVIIIIRSMSRKR
ncbi:MAG: hypothetical protein FWE68_00655, partial [Defluviitaleaceae bacterium]|nr:hypothetical protein [Defluviitaleaceae bacterium]